MQGIFAATIAARALQAVMLVLDDDMAEAGESPELAGEELHLIRETLDTLSDVYGVDLTHDGLPITETE